MRRHLQPELLDSLPPDSADARHSRRDLALLNRVVGNHAWFARTAPPLARAGEHALELGAGDGRLALALCAAGLTTDAIDRFPAPASWPSGEDAGGRRARWHVADLRDFDDWAEYAIIVGNLILHHLADDELRALGEKLDRDARVLVFNEPLRHLRSRILWSVGAPLGGANYVTRHDGRVSILAGFIGDELPRALGLDRIPGRWAWRVSTTLLGGYRLVATRRP